MPGLPHDHVSVPCFTAFSFSEMVCQRDALLIFMLLFMTGRASGCGCPAATILAQFPLEVPTDVCCLNYSGSAFSHVHWSLFSNETNIETLDLSFCNISTVDMRGKEASSLRKVYLGHNRLTVLPRDFLASQPGLTEVDLSKNQIEELPEGFLQDSESLQELYLQGNQLRFLPGSILQKPSLQRLGLDGNPWDCSCLLLEGLEESLKVNRTTKLEDMVGNLTCTSPRHLAGRTVLSVRLSDVCRPAGLTALFIVLPLIILSTLVLCWCCGRTQNKKDPPVSKAKKKASGSSCNGQKHHRKQEPATNEQNKTGLSVNEGIPNNHLLCPASTQLGSTRDIYEEVEIKLGSVESIPRVSSHCSSSTEGRHGSQEPDGLSRTELDTVSVTEVMKDSADREKAYLNQSTDYYSLVPGIELDDSDHGEYENVNLS
uniref:LRRCT domain-containing protein n=1 Tax=Mola mola TaxID=94237 RepID=A0A3Q3XHJ0_MOLML